MAPLKSLVYSAFARQLPAAATLRDDRLPRVCHSRQRFDEYGLPSPDMTPEKIGERLLLASHRKLDDLIVFRGGFVLAGKTCAGLDAVKSHLVTHTHHHLGKTRIVRFRRQQTVKGSIGL